MFSRHVRGKDHPAYVHFTEEQLDRLVEMYTVENQTMNDIAERYGITAITVRRRLAARGVEIKRTGRPRIVTDEMLLKAKGLREKGIEWLPISFQLGVAVATLKHRYRVMELENEKAASLG